MKYEQQQEPVGEQVLRKSIFNRLKIKCIMIWRILVHEDFILVAEKNNNVAFMCTMGAQRTVAHMYHVIHRINDHVDESAAIAEAEDILNRARS